ncbi:MAG TPA: hypothetical protein VLG37_03030 [Candidatus Saccharimonadales bacterium]|nr:hypothetical protein [Candidatus Saccharimonadales bacterium]
MSAEVFRLSDEEINTGLSSARQDFTGLAGYDAVCLGARNSAEQGYPKAIYVPAVKFIVRAVLDTLAQPDVEARLPRELWERSEMASQFAYHVADLGVAADDFLNFYVFDSIMLRGSIYQRDIRGVVDAEYLGSLGASPFCDVMQVAGGSFNLLRNEGVSEDSAQVIARSTGLLAISGTNKKYSPEAAEYLGQPYADPSHFELKATEEGTKVGFTPSTLEHLRRFQRPNGGCPAGRIAGESAGRTLLEEYWDRIVHYLMPPDATVQDEAA